MQKAGRSPIAMRTLRSFVRYKIEDRRWRVVVEVTELNVKHGADLYARMRFDERENSPSNTAFESGLDCK